MTGQIKGLLFDKDGTLLDFDATWGHWASEFLDELSQGDTGLSGRMADAVGFQSASRTFHPSSPVIASTSDEVIDLLLPFVPHWERQALMDYGNEKAAQADLVTTCALPELFDRFDAMGLSLGIATNDAERAVLRGSRGLTRASAGNPPPRCYWRSRTIADLPRPRWP